MPWLIGKAALLTCTPAQMLDDIEDTLQELVAAADEDTNIIDYAQGIIAMLSKHYVR